MAGKATGFALEPCSGSLDKRDDVATARLTVHNSSDEPFFLEPDAEYPCFVALACAEYKPRFNRPHQACPLGFAGAFGIEAQRSVSYIGLSQVYDAAVLAKNKQASSCPLIPGAVQTIRPRS